MGSEILITSADLAMPVEAEEARIKLHNHLKAC
jgi:hypothetical protein